MSIVASYSDEVKQALAWASIGDEIVIDGNTVCFLLNDRKVVH